jgi:DNA (cytosine-5)-methyltransferase 1
VTERPRVVELFAGVGGFRLGLERTGWRVVWSNQWEPSTRTQHASECYVRRFGGAGHVSRDIADVLDEVEAGTTAIPQHELLVGGYPCQDYSVARTLDQAAGIEGHKGVLWWQIHRLVRLMRPPLVLLENVDRLLKSPARQRGRDFAIMLATLADLDYEVEWRVVNAADYGFPQRRRRVFVVARDAATGGGEPSARLLTGALARAFPVDPGSLASSADPALVLEGSAVDLSERFGRPGARSPFRGAGVMHARHVWTSDVLPRREPPRTLGDVLEPPERVPSRYVIPDAQLDTWRYLKGSKREPRRHVASDTPWVYSEGPVPFPDPLDRPSRTILTGEGGQTPSRFKHVVAMPGGRLRRLMPVELERLNGFPDGWTADVGSDGRRAFLMGNALVVGLVERIGAVLAEEVRPREREVTAAAS